MYRSIDDHNPNKLLTLTGIFILVLHTMQKVETKDYFSLF